MIGQIILIKVCLKVKKVNYSKIWFASLFSISLGGCTVLSGVQTHNSPKEGIYTTELGTRVNVIPLNQQTLPATRLAEVNNKQEFSFLFNTPQNVYRLTSGDVLSIQLWNYPEIAPLVISNQQTAQAYGYPIDQSGYIQLPLLGHYKASGKILAQINKELRGGAMQNTLKALIL